MRAALPAQFVATAMLFVVSSQSLAQPSNSKALIDFGVSSHRASRQLIQTLSCAVSYKSERLDPPKSTASSGKYWCSEQAVRLTANEEFGGNKKVTDYVWKDGKRKWLVTTHGLAGAPSVGAGLSEHNERHLHDLDPFTRGGLSFTLPGTLRELPFEAIVDAAARVDNAVWANAQNLKCLLIRLHFEKSAGLKIPSTMEIYLDPSVNYLCRKVARYATDESQRREQIVTEFKEFPGGVLFPTRIEESLLQHQLPWGKATTEISELRINQPLPRDIFDLRFPNGIQLTDMISNEVYSVDSSGRRLSKGRPMAKLVTPPPPIETGTESVIGEPTKVEPRSIISWVLPISCGLLAIGLLVSCIKRIKSRQADA